MVQTVTQINSKENTVSASIGWLKNPVKVLQLAQQKHGLSFYLKLPILGKTFVTGNPNHIALIRNNPNLIGGRGMTILRPVLGNHNLIMLEGNAHKERRSALSGFFSPKRISVLDELMKTRLREAVLKHQKLEKTTVYKLLQEVLLTSIVAFIFPESNIEKRNKLEECIQAFFKSLQPSVVLFIRPLHVNLGKYNQWGRMKIAKQKLASLIVEMLQKEHHDLLQKTDMDLDVLVEEIIALLFFGHDTTAGTLAWVVHNCLDFSVNQEELLLNPAYTDAVINESMRLNSAVVHLTRVATKELNIEGNYIPKGMKVLPCAYLAHYNPAVFNNPYKFIPERFLNIKHDEDTFFPFGFGNRICIGKHLAMQQMRVLLPEIFKISTITKLLNGKTIAKRDNVLLVPKGDVKISLKRND